MERDKREEVKKLYPNSVRWAEKVDEMSDEQVTAIYIRAQSEGKLGK